MKYRIIKFKDEYRQDVWLAQKKGWWGWKPLHWTAAWHHCIENAQEEIDKRIREEYIKNLPKYEVIENYVRQYEFSDFDVDCGASGSTHHSSSGCVVEVKFLQPTILAFFTKEDLLYLLRMLEEGEDR